MSRKWNPADSYTASSGGVGKGSGEPLAVSTLNAGGFGTGSREPLAVRTLNPGGFGTGRGEPLAVSTLNAGGFGTGNGDPLATSTLDLGGFGTGSGEPLLKAAETTVPRLLDKCLTELLTGSTINAAKASTSSGNEIFFFTVEILLGATMKGNRKS